MGKVTATRFAEAGLSVVTAEANIRATAANGADVIAVPTNVSDAYAVAHLAEPAFKAGEAARLMNKARPLDSLAGPGCGPAEPCALVPRTATTPRCGGVPEWSIGAVSKTVVPLAGTVGSNPTPSAISSGAPPSGAASRAVCGLNRACTYTDGGSSYRSRGLA
jgi:hypothetical protein